MNITTFSTPGRGVLVISALLFLLTACSATATPRPTTNPPTAFPPPASAPASPAPTPIVTPPATLVPSPSPSNSPATSPAPGSPSAANPVAVFDVTGETFRIELVGAANLAHARALLAGTGDGPIPSGLLVLDDASVNKPWSWHIDPATLEWADVTTEVCDGRPTQIEDGTFTYERFCPWSAKLIRIEESR